MADLDYSISENVATLTLNRPERRNAFTLEMVDAWADRLLEADRDPEVRVIVVTGAGDAFCSGVDLDAFDPTDGRTPLENKQTLSQRIHRVALTMDQLRKPVIAALPGAAYGAGMDMALMADLRLAARSATFCEAYVRLGLVPGDGGAYYLPRIVGTSAALRLLWTAEVVDADEALHLGLVSEVHPDERLREATYSLATRIAANSPLAVQMIKQAVRSAQRSDLPTALDLISSHIGVIAGTEDAAEARAAFRERRDPVFHGR